MADVMAAIQAAIHDVDPAVAERYQVPMKPGEHAIGVLDDLSRRLVALQTLAFEQHGKIMLEYARIRQDPALLDNDAIVDRWVIDSRIIRARIAMLKTLFTFTAYAQFPEAIIRDMLVVRAGNTLVWCERYDKASEDLLGHAVGEIFARDSFPTD